MITRIAHLCIIARDLAETERFYCDVLSLEKGFSFHRNGREVGFYIHAGNQNYIEVFEGEARDASSAAPLRHFCLEVSDIDAVALRLKENGMTVTDKLLGCDQSWQIWCKDPNGIDIEFHQYTSESLQGRSGVVEL